MKPLVIEYDGYDEHQVVKFSNTFYVEVEVEEDIFYLVVTDENNRDNELEIEIIIEFNDEERHEIMSCGIDFIEEAIPFIYDAAEDYFTEALQDDTRKARNIDPWVMELCQRLKQLAYSLVQTYQENLVKSKQ